MSELIIKLCKFFRSSIGKKIVVAITGIFLVGFLISHLMGNFLIYKGADDFNHYAKFLHNFLHGWGIWIFRFILIVCFFLHIIFTVSLTIENRKSQEVNYSNNTTIRASKSSRIMIFSGLVILGFVIFHILHFTIPINKELLGYKKNQDVYSMVIKGFENPFVVSFYIIAISLMFSHIKHGIASTFQTLGLRGKKTDKLVNNISILLSFVLWFGFISIPFIILIKNCKLSKKQVSVKTIIYNDIKLKNHYEFIN